MKTTCTWYFICWRYVLKRQCLDRNFYNQQQLSGAISEGCLIFLTKIHLFLSYRGVKLPEKEDTNCKEICLSRAHTTYTWRDWKGNWWSCFFNRKGKEWSMEKPHNLCMLSLDYLYDMIFHWLHLSLKMYRFF